MLNLFVLYCKLFSIIGIILNILFIIVTCIKRVESFQVLNFKKLFLIILKIYFFRKF